MEIKHSDTLVQSHSGEAKMDQEEAITVEVLMETVEEILNMDKAWATNVNISSIINIIMEKKAMKMVR